MGALEWKGIKILVNIEVVNRKACISVVPSASSLLIKALATRSPDCCKQQTKKNEGSISLTDIYCIASVMKKNSFASSLGSSLRELLGTARSIGLDVVSDAAPPPEDH